VIRRLSGFLMYASYFVLFALFAINRYCLSPRSKRSINSAVKSVKVE
jgi:hypothetical protein